ncbi:hypothetical protein LSAT2_000385 [Lamellibrachia satsuma]|nr:hypothetical protein LSAT2_000385 [Lamellibrachia satsuma]
MIEAAYGFLQDVRTNTHTPAIFHQRLDVMLRVFVSLALVAANSANEIGGQFSCALHCENGFKTTETGRSLCECAEQAGCPAMQCTLLCDHGFEKDVRGCDVCACNVTSACPEVACVMLCETGFVRDDNGCSTCECRGESKCPGLSCNMQCPYGFRKDKLGCQKCECNRHACETLHCGVDAVCVATTDDCSALSCASSAKCVPAKDIDQPSEREVFSFVLFIVHSTKDTDVDTELLKWYVREKLSHWLRLRPDCIVGLHLQLLTVKMARVRIRFELAKDNGCRPRNVTLRLLAFMNTSGNLTFRGATFEADPRSLEAVTYFDEWLQRQICFAVSCLVLAFSFLLLALILTLVFSYMQRLAHLKKGGQSLVTSSVDPPEKIPL